MHIMASVSLRQAFSSLTWSSVHQRTPSLLRTCQLCGIRYASTKASRVMRAWETASYGGYQSLSLSTTTPVPVVRRPDEVLVKVHAASINPVDHKLMDGYGASTLNALRKAQGLCKPGAELPMTPGRDFSGVVVNVGRGKGGVGLKPGDEVWGSVLPIQPRGCLAEYVLAPAVGVCRKPGGVSHVEAASLPYVGLTTWSALCTIGGLSPSNTARKRVLVLGGSGGIGTFAIQLVKAWSGEVTTTCSADAVQQVTELGADMVLDYRDPDVDKTLSELRGFDVILDATGDQPDRYTKLLTGRGGSAYITILSPILQNADQLGLLPGMVKSALTFGPRLIQGQLSGQNYYWAVVQNSPEALKTMTHLVTTEKIKPVIDQVFGFEDVPAAFSKLVKGPNRGKTVVDLSPEAAS